MPRTTDADERPKRVPRKRTAVKRASVKKVARKKTATRKRTVKKATTKKTSPETFSSEEGSTRKAPTPIAARRATKKNQQRQVIVVGVLIFLGVGASAAVGFTDAGRIDVNKTIEARNERIQKGELDDRENANSRSVQVPVQNAKNNLPDGGLRGLGIGAEPPKPAQPATSTATSTATTTPATASSTASTTEDIVDTEETSEESEDQDQTTEDSEETEAQAREELSDSATSSEPINAPGR